MEDNKVKFCEKSTEGTIARFTFGNGTTLELDVSSLEEDIQRELMLHGALQKIGDSYAGAAGDYDFAISNAQKVIDNLIAGNWKAARAASGESKPRTTELAEAIARIKGIDVAQASAIVEALSDEQRKAIRAKETVKATIAQIRYEKAQAKAAKASAEDLGI